MTNDELIVKHLEGWSGLALESVKYYGETGHVSGSLLLALRGMLVDKENEVKNLALPQVSKCEGIEREALLNSFSRFLEGYYSETGINISDIAIDLFQQTI